MTGVRDPAPLIGASWAQATRRFWTGAFSFGGRASRSEFWWQRLTDLVVVALATVVVPQLTGPSSAPASDPFTAYHDAPGFLGIGQTIVGLDFGGGPGGSLRWFFGGPPEQWVLFVWCVATVVPNVALGFRRLRDRGGPPWAALLGGLPLIDLALLIAALGRSVPDAEMSPLDGRGDPGAARHRSRAGS